MISTAHRFIFLHVPKTGGNAIQTGLVAYSDDHITARGKHQDGVDRFNIRGPITTSKHATLSEYAAALGTRLDDFSVTITCREPLQRAIAYYFSPHFWHRELPDGRHERIAPVWDADAAAMRVHMMVPAVEFLRIDGQLRTPDFVIHQESLQDDLRPFLDHVRVPRFDVPRRNVGFVEPSERARAEADEEFIALVAERFAADYAFFGYPRPDHASERTA